MGHKTVAVELGLHNAMWLPNTKNIRDNVTFTANCHNTQSKIFVEGAKESSEKLEIQLDTLQIKFYYSCISIF